MELEMSQYLLVILLLSLHLHTDTCSASIPQELPRGFSATPQSKTAPLEPLLTDPSGNFSLAFLRLNQDELALAVVHVASSEPLWVANPRHPASWSHTTRLSFNGTLSLSDPKTNLLWSSSTTSANSDAVVLLNTSNLQIVLRNGNGKGSTSVWQSFDFPGSTLVQEQNLTANMSLTSENGLYSLRLGNDFMGLYANNNHNTLYWKRTPLETKDSIKEGAGPILARVSQEGYLAMYQATSKPLDVQKFDSFQQTPTSSSFLLLRLEPDGNLKGYYWDGQKSTWVLNYQAITDTCDLPSPCGSYGLCTPGGSGCSCLDNRTRFQPGGCFGGYSNGDLCGGESFWVLRRSGVEPPFKELLGHVTTSSLAECEGLCESNCSCWGALYNNATGFCYVMDYPIQTMTGAGDESKMGYFKVRESEGGRNRVRARVGVVVGVLVGMVGVGIGIGICRRRKRGGMLSEENGASPGPYKNLVSASFRSIEMSSGL